MWLFPEDYLVEFEDKVHSFFYGNKVIVITGQSLVHLNSEKNMLKMK